LRDELLGERLENALEFLAGDAGKTQLLDGLQGVVGFQRQGAQVGEDRLRVYVQNVAFRHQLPQIVGQTFEKLVHDRIRRRLRHFLDQWHYPSKLKSKFLLK